MLISHDKNSGPLADETAIVDPVDADTPAHQQVAERQIAEALIVDLEGFEGPLDVLLSLGRSQKLDLRQISILQLARQYLEFVEHAQALRIELAADYLVMAAWLAFLKSRLLLPSDPTDEGPSGQDMAAQLAFQLERLQAMRDAGAQLMARAQKGSEFFERGDHGERGGVKVVRQSANLLDLMSAYARLRTKDDFRPFVMDRDHLLTMEQALNNLKKMIDMAGEWSDLVKFLPNDWRRDDRRQRSAVASTFAASLELVKSGDLQIRQAESFAPIEIKRGEDPA